MGGNVNHLPISRCEFEIGLINGTPVVFLCMETFVPRLRVGSGGRADEPAWPMCPDCETVLGLLKERSTLRKERNRIAREIRALDKQCDQIWERVERDEKIVVEESPGVTLQLST